MAFTRYQIVLIALFAASGSVHTISVKWMDMMEAVGVDGQLRHFSHPFVQADFMFLGECLCLAAFSLVSCILRRRRDGSVEEHQLTRGSRMFNRFVLWPPALMDLGATSLMYLGLTMTSASSYQMLRGADLIFVALFSIIFLKRKLKAREWIGIALVLISLFMIGIGDYFEQRHKLKTSPTSGLITGDIIVIVAQLLLAGQMVYEEMFVRKLDIPPLQMVGWEGVFGFICLTMFLLPFNLLPTPFKDHQMNSSRKLSDPYDALVKIANNPLLLVPLIGLTTSIAVYNFSGVSITKECSATTRMVLDTFRIVIVWLVSLLFQWQSFHYIQIVGFTTLFVGTCVYNDILVSRILSYFKREEPADNEL